MQLLISAEPVDKQSPTKGTGLHKGPNGPANHVIFAHLGQGWEDIANKT